MSRKQIKTNKMKTLTSYQRAKAELKQISVSAKKYCGNDLSAIRMTINDGADYICKNTSLSEHQQNLLHNYACTLHPKTK